MRKYFFILTHLRMVHTGCFTRNGANEVICKHRVSCPTYKFFHLYEGLPTIPCANLFSCMIFELYNDDYDHSIWHNVFILFILFWLFRELNFTFYISLFCLFLKYRLRSTIKRSKVHRLEIKDRAASIAWRRELWRNRSINRNFW